MTDKGENRNMSKIAKLNSILTKRFGNCVSAHSEQCVTVLTGQLENWQDIVKAGFLAAHAKRSLGVVNDISLKGTELPETKLPKITDSTLEGKRCDVLVIGAGVVGCAIARELARWDISVMLIDKEHDVALHASSRNDGAVHPGIDLVLGQVKRNYNLRGNRMYGEICRQLGVPFKRIGQYLCFKNKSLKFLIALGTLYYKAMGVPVQYISGQKIHKIEPHLSEDICCALFFPSAGIVCPYGLTIAYAENAVDNGVQLYLDTAVLGMELSDHKITSVSTNRGTIYPKIVVNAAGVFSEEIAKMAQDRFFSIHPRHGTSCVLDKKATEKSKITVSSFGTSALKSSHSKGGGIVKTADGNLLVGPDAFETFEKENFETNVESIDAVLNKQRATVPSIGSGDIITYFTGVRAATYEEDFVITEGKFTKNIVHAAGIQSPGLTAAPAIGQDVARMAVSLLERDAPIKKSPTFNPLRTPIPKTSEMDEEQLAALIEQNPDYGVIVCRCEQISKGEIIDALNRSVPCDTIDGVKRRVRPGMGRCQGGFCGAAVAQMIAQQKGIPLKEVTKNGAGSFLVFGGVKEDLQ